MRQSLSKIEKELRRAVESQQFPEVQLLVVSFCEAVEAHVRALPAGDPSIPAVASMVDEVLQWTRSMLYAARESFAAQLREIPKINEYLHGRTVDTAVLRLDV